jgi:hypothetical protein
MRFQRALLISSAVVPFFAALAACSDDDAVVIGDAGVDVSAPTVDASADTAPAPDASTDAAVATDAATDTGSPDTSVDTGTAPKISSPALLPALVAGVTVAGLQLTGSGDAPITWAVTAGALPAGMTLSAAGLYSGTPTTPGTVKFTVTATNAAGTDSLEFTQVVALPAADAHVLLDQNRIAALSTAFAAFAGAPKTIAGLAVNDTLVGIDRRPNNGYLYGIASNSSSGAVTLYNIDFEQASAYPVGAPGTFDTAIVGGAFGMDFNPGVDRVRVVTLGGHNFRINPNDGALIDGDTVTMGLQRDSAINGAANNGRETAYTNNVINNGNITTQYTVTGGSIYIQNPPNAGTLTFVKAAPNVETILGFDIAPGVNAASSNAAVAAGAAHAVIKLTGQTAEQLATIDLVSGAVTPLGTFGFTGVRGLSLNKAPGRTVIGLSADGTTLLRFLDSSPGAVVNQGLGVGSLATGEQLVGIDFRPATGQLYGLGVNAATNKATLYLVDPQGGALTPIGATGQISFVTAGGAPVDLPDAATGGYGIDFNPSVDRLRVVTASGLNFRINPNTGAPIDGDQVAAGVNPDGAISGGGTGLDGVAYTNGPTPVGGAGVTTEYGISAATDSLHLVSVPNSGTLAAAVGIKLNGTPLNFTSVSGFDIPQSTTTAANNAAVASGSAYAALTVGGVTSLYRIDLVTGAASLLGAIGAGNTALAGLAVGQ